MNSRLKKVWEITVQVGLPAATLLGFLLISMGKPEWGVVVSLGSQVFWLYSSYHAWRGAGQLGIFINTILATMIFTYGVINYWFL